jgi:hypothetical protein
MIVIAHYTLYDPSTGHIRQTVSCSPAELALYLNALTAAIPGEWSASDYVVNPSTQQPMPRPVG